MNFDDKTYKTIEDYLHGRLSESDKVAFESLMEENDNLNQEVQELRELMHFIGEDDDALEFEVTDKSTHEKYVNYFESEESEKLNDLLEEVFADPNETGKVISINRKPFIYKLIAAMLVIALGIPFVLKIISTSPNKLYSANFIVEDIEWVEKGVENELKSQAEFAFNAKDYVAAKESLEEIVALEANNYEAIYYLALCNQKLEDFDQAKIEYQKITASSSLLKNDAFWNLTLIELKEKNYTAALENLGKIAKDKKYDQKKLKLEKKLKRLLKS